MELEQTKEARASALFCLPAAALAVGDETFYCIQPPKNEREESLRSSDE